MWSCRILVLAVALTFAGGCGFHPMYAPPAAGEAGTAPELASVRVPPIADRAGQELRQELLRTLAPEGTVGDPRWVLSVDLRETTDEVALERTGLGSRATVRMDASFVLTDSATGTAVASGSSRAVNSFNLGNSEFSVVVSEQDARSRSVQRIAADIRSRLSAYFARAAKS